MKNDTKTLFFPQYLSIFGGLGASLNEFTVCFFLLALQPTLGVVFYSPLVGFSLLVYEVS